jgi:hypothetical protein
MEHSVQLLRLNCAICNKPVDLKTTKTNEAGKAVHEECYVLREVLKRATQPIHREPAGKVHRPKMGNHT